MRKKIVAGNWKMNQDYTSGTALFSEVLTMIDDEILGNQEVIVCPPFIHLSTLGQLAKNSSKVFIGAQNCHQADAGAFTGEVSAAMIQSVGAKYVIIGHSERRQYFGESDELLAEKVKSALKNGLSPIFCIGETLQKRESGNFLAIIAQQLNKGLFHLAAEALKQVILAYEPVWAIGTGLTASPEQAQEVHAFIRKTIADAYGAALAEEISILYGGSCNPKNAAELFAQADIDGGLIGGASLKSRDFVDIVKTFNSR